MDLGFFASGLKGKATNDFDFGLSDRKPLYKSTPFAFPSRYVLDTKALTAEDRAKVATNKFLNLNEAEKKIELKVGAIVVATGWQPYAVENLLNLGAGCVKNCVTNMQFERIASPYGPFKGQVVRPSDGKAPKRVAFVQCAGSRDQNHLNYCSYVCCMASIKQCQYVVEAMPNAHCDVYYIDLRTPGRYVKVLDKVRNSGNVTFIKGKVANVEQIEGDRVRIQAEDAVRGEKLTMDYDMVVLATGMRPTLATMQTALPVRLDEEGFISGGEEEGIFAAGCALMPLDVTRTAQTGTAAALKAVQLVEGR